MPLLEIQVDSYKPHLHMLDRPAEARVLLVYSRLGWCILAEWCSGKAFMGTSHTGLTKETTKATPGPLETSINVGLSENETTALGQTGWELGWDKNYLSQIRRLILYAYTIFGVWPCDYSY